jgi:hypothetical protein
MVSNRRKEMKKTSLTIAIAMFLGILCLGFFAGCADILNGPPAGIPESGPAGTGRVTIRLGPRTKGARTFMPSGTNFEALSFSYTFKTDDKDPVTGLIKGPVTGEIIEEETSVVLETGTWTLTVEGMDGSSVPVLEGIVRDIEISYGETNSVDVPLQIKAESGGTGGSLSYSISFPDTVTRGSLTVYRWENGEKEGPPEDLLSGTSSDGGMISKTGNLNLPAGYYRVDLDLYMADGLFTRTDIAHIYKGMNTAAEWDPLSAADFTPAETGASLAAVLNAISGLPEGAKKTYLLPSVPESMTAKSVSNSNGPVFVTIDGGGREVALDGLGSLITLNTLNKANVHLVLKNITLKGRGLTIDNNAALVTVISGSLELGTGVFITDNKHSETASNSGGGGVYVDQFGTFTMSGGKISGNTASTSSSDGYAYGGGVYVGSYTNFIMSGGEISGNTASANAASYGGGVYLASSPFGATISGGKISGNRVITSAYSSSSLGGGVYVGRTFTMSGGEISDNTADSSSGSNNDSSSNSYGGGIYAKGAFTMNGGEISDNHVLSDTYSNAALFISYGGGVYTEGPFTMSSGTISGNSAEATRVSRGGGVYTEGTFAMSGGTISGNAASASVYSSASAGGGVYVVSEGTSTMSGGEISDNNSFSFLSSYYSISYGGGVCTEGPFIMDGGEISRNTAESSICYGGGMYAFGSFNMSGGTISGNTADASFDSFGGGVYAEGTFILVNGGKISDNSVFSGSSSWSAYGGGVLVWGIFNMLGGEISGNTVTTSYPGSRPPHGGGVYVDSAGAFAMLGGEISSNTASSNTASSYGGGVAVHSSGTFTKNEGGVIYGTDTAGGALENTAGTDGYAVYVSSGKKRNATVGIGDRLDSGVDGADGGWIDPPGP